MEFPEREKKPKVEKKERPEVEEELLPWERLEERIDFALREEYGEQAVISSQIQTKIEDELENLIKQERIEMVKKWFQRHREEIREKGYDPNITDEGYIYRIVEEMEGFKDLERDPEYEESRERIEFLGILHYDSQKRVIPLETQFALLNVLGRELKIKEEELEKARKKGAKESQLEEIGREIDELYKIRKELAEKLTGENLREKIERKLPYFPKRGEYIEEKISQEGFLPFADSKKGEYGYLKGSPPEKKTIFTFKRKSILGIFRKRIEVKDEKGNIKGEFKTYKEAEEFLKKETEKLFQRELREEFGREWEEENLTREKEIKKGIEEEIENLSRAPERAREGIEEIKRRIKNRLIGEFVERDLTKEPKAKQELEEIKKEFEKGEERDFSKFISQIYQKEGELAELSGEKEKDAEALRKFLGHWGVKMEPEELAGCFDELEKKGVNYQEALKKKKGLVRFLVELLFAILFEVGEKMVKG